MHIFISALISFLSFCSRLFFAVLPSVLVLAVLTQSQITGDPGVPSVRKSNYAAIHELIPNSSWNDLEPCGLHFDEKEEFAKARQCVNEKVWPDSPLTTNELDFPIPRCFIIKAQSPNVISKDGINFVLIFDIMGAGAVVGVYQPETHTVFVVENADAAMVYRHELQHYFLHEHDPETAGGGHHQTIWQKCEPPYYTPSKKASSETEAEATPTATETPSN